MPTGKNEEMWVWWFCPKQRNLRETTLEQIEKVTQKNHHGVYMITLWQGMFKLNNRERLLENCAIE